MWRARALAPQQPHSHIGTCAHTFACTCHFCICAMQPNTAQTVPYSPSPRLSYRTNKPTRFSQSLCAWHDVCQIVSFISVNRPREKKSQTLTRINIDNDHRRSFLACFPLSVKQKQNKKSNAINQFSEKLNKSCP